MEGAGEMETPEDHNILLGLALLALFAVSVRFLWPTNNNSQPPMLGEAILYISITYPYLTSMEKFLSRAAKAQGETHLRLPPRADEHLPRHQEAGHLCLVP